MYAVNIICLHSKSVSYVILNVRYCSSLSMRHWGISPDFYCWVDGARCLQDFRERQRTSAFTSSLDHVYQTANTGCWRTETASERLVGRREAEHDQQAVGGRPPRYASAPLLPRGHRSALRCRADGNIAAVSCGQHVLTPTAAAAWRVNTAVSKAAWWPWPLTFWPWKWCPSHVWRRLPLSQFRRVAAAHPKLGGQWGSSLGCLVATSMVRWDQKYCETTDPLIP